MLVELTHSCFGREGRISINPYAVAYVEELPESDRCSVQMKTTEDGALTVLAPFAEVVAKINDALAPPTEDTAYTLAK